jgi:hypothetical protein
VCVNNNYKDGLELNGTHQILAYADDNNLMGKNINNMKKNRDALSDASKESFHRSIIFIHVGSVVDKVSLK